MAKIFQPFKLDRPAYIQPNVIADEELSDREFRIYTVIHSIIGGKVDGYCWLTDEQIANATGKSKQTIQRAISRLAEKGYIWIDLNQKRQKENKAPRHIYTSETCYNNRFKARKAKEEQKELNETGKFKDLFHFINYAKKHARGFEFTFTKVDGVKMPLQINHKGMLLRTLNNKILHGNDEKELIHEIWQKMFDSDMLKEKIIEYVQNQWKKEKE